MEKRTVFLALASMIFACSVAHAESIMSPREQNIDRPGADFDSFQLPEANVTLCENSCGADTRCAAWNYDPTHGNLRTPMCFLKGSAPHPTLHLEVIGGVKIRP
jgi:hypothetical protein